MIENQNTNEFGAFRSAHPAKENEPVLALFQKVKQYISEQIQSGRWRPGERIPSENQLVESLGVSRMTVNRSLRELTQEGILMRRQGVGTFVSEIKPLAGLVEVRSISDEIERAGGMHSCTVHLLEAETVSSAVAQALGLQTGAEVYHSVIVHKNHGRPVQLAERWVNPFVAPEFLKQDFRYRTPHHYLQEVAPIQQAQHILEAILPDKRAQRLLEIKPSEPCLLLLRRTWALGQVATDSRFIYPGSRYRMGGRFAT
jgi:GntR family histidine utilization transcriptional repressor